MSNSAAAPPLPAREQAGSPLAPIFVAIASLVVLLYALNWTLPWESDQPAKAAQIIEIADSNDYFLSDKLSNFYRLRLFSLFYAASALLFKVVGGPIFTAMNVTSVAIGVVTIVSLVYALRNALGIRPLWSTFVLLAMPLMVTNSIYGNEVCWSFGFLAFSLWLLSTRRGWLPYAGAAMFACSLFCRADMVLVGPFWAAWALLFGITPGTRTQVFRQLALLGIVFGASCIVLWLALLRTIPATSTSFEWDTNLKLVVSYLSYPFNPSVTVIAAFGWLFLCRANLRYALAHLLLLLPLVFYFGNLASPKYIIVMILFYALPAAYLFDRSGPRVRVGLVATVLLWFFVGISPFGVFGPAQASLWYVPTADGPCPIGGYVDFYRRSRQGFYQAKQQEYLVQTRSLYLASQTMPPDVKLLARYSTNAFPLARLELGRERPGEKFELPPNATLADEQVLIQRIDYLSYAKAFPDWADRLAAWLKNGQVRAAIASDRQAFPDVIEIGAHVPAGSDVALGECILFMAEHYEGFKVFQLPQFVPAYRATSWLSTEHSEEVPPNLVPIYRDAEYLGFDREVAGGQSYGFPWPERYFKLQAPTKTL